MNDVILFGVLPYVSLVLFFVMTVQRYRQRKFSYSSLSSQFLENRKHFWSSVPFHYGILGVLAGHILAFLVPEAILGWNAEPWRLLALEVTGMALGLMTLFGLVSLFVRRVLDKRLRKVSSVTDWILYGLLFAQVVSGTGIAYHHSWGSSWFATNASPWLWSLLTFDPAIEYVAPLPWLIKAHIVGAFVIIGFFPFTRLVHVLVVPNMYLWRKPQLVMWNRRSHRKALPRHDGAAHTERTQ